MTTKEQAEQDYMAGMKYKDIAAKYDVTINTVKSWKTRGKWVREKGAHKTKKGAHKNEPVKKVQEVVEEPEIDEDGLTTKQAQFAYLVANGMSKSNAYREAYDVIRMSNNAIWVEASKAASNPKIALRISGIQKELLANSGWSRERSYSEKNNFLEEVKRTFEKDGRIGQGTATAFMSVVSDLDAMLDSDVKRKQRAEADISEAKAKEIVGADEANKQVVIVNDLGGGLDD